MSEAAVGVLGDFVKERRAALGITQDDLAERIGRDQRFVSRLENNRKEFPAPETIAALSTALEVPQTDILRSAGYLDVIAEWDGDAATRWREHEIRRDLVAIRAQIDRIISYIDDGRAGDTAVTNG